MRGFIVEGGLGLFSIAGGTTIASGSFNIPSGVDPTGVSDSTSALQVWINSLVTSGDPGYLPSGTYKTSDTLVASGSSGILIQGAGANRTRISLTAANKPVFRVNITGDGNATPCGFIADIGVQGPTANPTDFKAGFLLDACRGFQLIRTDVSNMDIGYDFVNNCFNSSLWAPSVKRFNTVNVGINLRGFDTGFQSGNDISIYDAVISCKLCSVMVGPNSGGFHFFGGQFGTSGLTVDRDDLACIMLGIDYNTLATGGCTADFYGLSLEGVTRTWFIQTYDEVVANFHNMGYTPSASGVNAALGILKVINAKQSQLSFTGFQNIQSGGTLKTSIASVAGAFSAAIINEDAWHQGSLTVNSVAKAALSMRSLTTEAGFLNQGLGKLSRSSRSTIILGTTEIRSNVGVLEKSIDSGGSWTPI